MMVERDVLSRRAVLRFLTLFAARPAGVLAVVAGRAGVARAGGRCAPTQADLEGPFYLPGAPSRIAIAPPEEPGDRLIVRGHVLGPDCATPLAGAVLDVWQADAQGSYHGPAEQYRLRGRLQTDAEGRYELFTIRPGAYRIGDRFRPAHIHMIVTHRAHAPLTTQLYFKGDPYLAPNDACGAACKSGDPGRIIGLRKEGKMGGEFLAGMFDVVLGQPGT
jgi:catechol 1,2-dioxygenase